MTRDIEMIRKIREDLGSAFVWAVSLKGYKYWLEVYDNLLEEADREV